MNFDTSSTTGTGVKLLRAALVISVIAVGFGLIISSAAGGAPANPTTTPGELNVSLTDGAGTANATWGINQTTGTVNVSRTDGTSDARVDTVSTGNTAKAINFAILNATAANNTVIVGNGTFNGTVDVSTSAVSNINNSANTTTIDGFGSDGFFVNTTGVNVTGFDNVTNSTNGLNFSSGARNVTSENNNITNAARGVLTSGASGLTVSGGLVDNAVNNGIRLASGSDNVTVDGVSINDTGLAGVNVASAQDVVIENSPISNTSSAGIRAATGGNVTVRNNVITDANNRGISGLLNATGNDVDGTSFEGIMITGGTGFNVSDNTVNDTDRSGGGNSGIQIDSSSTFVGNNTVTNTGFNGIEVTANGANLTDNTITGAGANGTVVDGANNVEMVNNDINSSSDDGLAALNGVSNLNVTGGVIDGTTSGFGIWVVDGSPDNVTVEGVTVSNIPGGAGIIVQAPDSVVNGSTVTQITGGTAIRGGGLANVTNNVVRDAANSGVLQPNNAIGNDIDGVNDAGITKFTGGIIRDNTINDTDQVGSGSPGIEVSGVNTLVDNNTVTNAGFNGIDVLADGANLTDNTITNADANGTLIDGANNVNLTNNNITSVGSSNADAVRLLGSLSDITVTGGSIDLSASGRNGVRGFGPGYTSVTGLTVENVNIEGATLGVNVQNGDNSTIRDNNITNTDAGGISLASSPDSVIENNLVENAGNGFTGTDGIVFGGDNVTVSSNVVDRVETSDSGIRGGLSATNAVISDNSINGTQGGDGVLVEGSDSLLNNNTVTNAGGNGTLVDGASNVNLTRNNVTTTGGSGVFVDGDSATLTNNNISDVGVAGVFVNGALQTTITDGLIENTQNEGIFSRFSPDNMTVDGVRINNTGTTGAGAGAKINGQDSVMRNSRVTNTGSDGISASGVTNVTLENNVLRDIGGDGIFGDDVRVLGNDIDGTTLDGLDISPGAQNVSDNIINDTGENGILADASTDFVNNTISNTALNGTLVTANNVNLQENSYDNIGASAVFVDGVTGTTLTNTTVRDASNWALEAINGGTVASATGFDVGPSTNPNTTLDFDAQDVRLNNATTPVPADPSNKTNVSRYFNATDASASAFLNVTVNYQAGDLGAISNESTLALNRYDGTNWGELSSSSVDTTANEVSANVTTFSTFGVLGAQPANFTVTNVTTNSPINETETLDVTANVTNVGEETATQTIELNDTFNNDTVRDSVDVTLAGGASNSSVNLQWSTVRGDNGTGPVTVSSVNDTSTSTVEVRAQPYFAVNITDTNQPVEGENLTVNGTVTNTGNLSDTQTVNLTDFNGNEVDSSTFSIAGNSQQTFNFTWSTSVGDNATDTVNVSSENQTDTATVTVLEKGSIAVTIDTTNDPVVEGDALTVNGTAQNTGQEDNVTQTINLTQFDGSVVDSTSVTLDGGNQTTFNFTWNTVRGDNGTDDVTVTSENDTATQTVQVLALPFFDVQITSTTSPINAQEILNVTANVTNTGDLSDTQTVNFTNFNGDVVDNATLTLAGGGSSTETFSWQTTVDDGGTNTVNVSSANDTASVLVSIDDLRDRRELGRGQEELERERSREMGRGENGERDDLRRDSGRNRNSNRRDQGRSR